MTAPSPVPSSLPPQDWAVCLCAQWCGTCREYRPLFDALAQQYPGVRFVWLDVEDEAELAGDYDVETFPTLLVGNAAGVHFMGPVLPQVTVLERLLEHVRAGSLAPLADADALALFHRIQKAQE